MIQAIIFDFGDVLIDLNKAESLEAFRKIGLEKPNEQLLELNDAFERGKISEQAFLSGIQSYIPTQSIETIKSAWNTLIGDFPLERLELLQMLKSKYKLFLLTNTDIIHMEAFEEEVGASFASAFYQCFEKVYYSHEMGMRKPDPQVYLTILRKHDLIAERTLFIDDKKENTDAAAQLGLQVWNLQVGKETIMNLYEKGIL
ncbi:HAD family hydrolase [Flavobacterium sp.]|uniref:HAD family hydrolase n=1 Tax=Flavobacterium sp. TaxID=239 RepID=UPI003B9D8F40